MPFDAILILYVAAVLLLAGFTKGIIGFGLPSISMGLLGLMMPPSQAAALLLAPNIVTNIQQGLMGPALRPLLKRLALFWGRRSRAPSSGNGRWAGRTCAGRRGSSASRWSPTPCSACSRSVFPSPRATSRWPRR